jgi:hypothetical protein
MVTVGVPEEDSVSINGYQKDSGAIMARVVSLY